MFSTRKEDEKEYYKEEKPEQQQEKVKAANLSATMTIEKFTG